MKYFLIFVFVCLACAAQEIIRQGGTMQVNLLTGGVGPVGSVMTNATPASGYGALAMSASGYSNTDTKIKRIWQPVGAFILSNRITGSNCLIGTYTTGHPMILLYPNEAVITVSGAGASCVNITD